ncbi:hypothetical protein PPUJ20066_46340 [Pseudomonas putida]|nr:hypothetical protein PPUJ20066_46340 [Pseudomonas putida]
MNHTGKETAGQCGLVPDQLTKMGEGKQRNCAALYLLREIKPVDSARYVKRPLGALHSGHWERARATVATAQGSVEKGAVVP